MSNLLLPAACLSSVTTNAAAADLYDAGMYCTGPADYDEVQSQLLNDYISQLARYHFVWSAYETVRGRSGAGRLLTSRTVDDRRALAGRVPSAQLEMLDQVFRMSSSLTQGNDKILESLKNKNETLVVGWAGLIAAGFRNYIFHGHEVPPRPEGPSVQSRAKLAGEEAVSVEAHRLAWFTRLTFQLIQILTHAELRPGHTVQFDNVPFLPSLDRDLEVPSRFVLNLANSWPETESQSPSGRALEHLAMDCGVPEKLLDLLISLVACNDQAQKRLPLDPTPTM